MRQMNLQLPIALSLPSILGKCTVFSQTRVRLVAAVAIVVNEKPSSHVLFLLFRIISIKKCKKPGLIKFMANVKNETIKKKLNAGIVFFKIWAKNLVAVLGFPSGLKFLVGAKFRQIPVKLLLKF